jgi:hypothetical protein
MVTRYSATGERQRAVELPEHPLPGWTSTRSGRAPTRGERRQLRYHVGEWRAIAAGDATRLVLEDHMRIAEGAHRDVDRLLAGDGWDVAVLGRVDKRPSRGFPMIGQAPEAYCIRPEAARRLVDAIARLPGWVPVEDLLFGAVPDVWAPRTVVVRPSLARAHRLGTFPVVWDAPDGDHDQDQDHGDDDDLAALLELLTHSAVPDPEVEVVGPDIVRVQLWTARFCAALVAFADRYGAWSSLRGDAHPGEEVRLERLAPSLHAAVAADVALRVGRAIRGVWPFGFVEGYRDLFVIRYRPGVTSALRLHHDVSYVSGSVKLDDGYRGGELRFPRQGWDNGDVAVGDVVLWPGMLTHEHESSDVVSGVKHSMTIWTWGGGLPARVPAASRSGDAPS